LKRDIRFKNKVGLFKKILGKDKPSKKKKAPQKSSSISVGQSNQSKEKKSALPAKKGNINIYRSIQSAHITEKAGTLTEQNKYVFKVYSRTNKPEIKKSIEALYGVKVEKIHIVHSMPKKMRLGRREGFKHGLKKGFKKAIVTLKEGDKIELSPR